MSEGVHADDLDAALSSMSGRVAEQRVAPEEHFALFVDKPTGTSITGSTSSVNRRCSPKATWFTVAARF